MARTLMMHWLSPEGRVACRVGSRAQSYTSGYWTVTCKSCIALRLKSRCRTHGWLQASHLILDGEFCKD